MNQTDLDYLIQEFGPVIWKSFDSKRGEDGVFLLKVTPLPPPDEVEQVIVDIYAGGIPVCVNNGRIYHSSNCTCETHTISDDLIKEAIPRLREETFLVAVHPNTYVPAVYSHLPYDGKPLVIPFNPIISYMNFPDHPHLNMGTNRIRLPGTIYPIPDTICFTAEPNSGLGTSQIERLIYTFDEVTIWLLRHQIWVATREIAGHGIWVGPHEGQIEAEYFPGRLNPHGLCRCGNKKLYSSCHLKLDLEALGSKHGRNVVSDLEKQLQTGVWAHTILLPQIGLYQALDKLASL